MTEEKDPTDAEETLDLEEAFPGEDEESTPEEVTVLPEEIEVKDGDAADDALEQLRPVCTLAEKNYQGVQEHIKKFRTANLILKKFHARDSEVSPKDVDQAKKEFNNAKKSYLELSRKINEGIKTVHFLAKSYPQDLLVQNLYSTYLAKLLSSLETRNEVESFVNRAADYMFVFDREDVILTEEEERRDMTVAQKKSELLEDAEKKVNRLEARFQKRQLQNQLRQEDKPLRTVNRLIRISRLDPDDIHTLIWIAQLLSGELPKQRDQNRRLEMRDDILNYCQRAFSMIDDFLNLQGIQNLTERDKRRSEYLKTITHIRKPLLAN